MAKSRETHAPFSNLTNLKSRTIERFSHVVCLGSKELLSWIDLICYLTLWFVGKNRDALSTNEKEVETTWLARIFPRLAPVTYNCFHLRLVNCPVCIQSDWSESLLPVCFYDTLFCVTKLNCILINKRIRLFCDGEWRHTLYWELYLVIG